MKAQKKDNSCVNCGGCSEVSVSIPCPTCSAHGINEINALRRLASYVRTNTQKRTKAPKLLISLLNELAIAQGKPGVYDE